MQILKKEEEEFMRLTPAMYRQPEEMTLDGETLQESRKRRL